MINLLIGEEINMAQTDQQSHVEYMGRIQAEKKMTSGGIYVMVETVMDKSLRIH